jgi:hypothetical protein
MLAMPQHLYRDGSSTVRTASIGRDKLSLLLFD